MDFIVWMDYTSPGRKRASACWMRRGAATLSCLWSGEGNLKLTDSEEYDNAVELRTVDEDQLVLTVRLVQGPGQTPPAGPGWAWWRPARCRQNGPGRFAFQDQNYRLVQGVVSAELRNGGTVHGTSACGGRRSQHPRDDRAEPAPCGMEAVEADSAEVALPLLEKKPGCDAAILDVMLPGMNGFSLCETIRRTDQKIGIIIPERQRGRSRTRSAACPSARTTI